MLIACKRFQESRQVPGNAPTAPTDERIRTVWESLRGDAGLAELCRREGINPKPLLPLVKGVSGSWQEASGRRYGTSGWYRSYRDSLPGPWRSWVLDYKDNLSRSPVSDRRSKIKVKPTPSDIAFAINRRTPRHKYLMS